MKKILGKAFEFLYYGLLLFIAFILFSSALPVPGGIKTFIVQSGSMEPAIKTGSVVVVRSKSAYSIGNIITFGPNTRETPPTTHRIVDVERIGNSFYYTTKGDANNSPDPRKIRHMAVIGKVMFSVPYLGYGVAAAQKPLGFVLLAGIPAGALIIIESQKIIREIKSSRKKKEEDQKISSAKPEESRDDNQKDKA